LRCTPQASILIAVRDRYVIDSKLRLIAAVRQVCRWHGGSGPFIGLVDELLDQRNELTGS
jgi:hypothetical protein